uniref:AAA+ ATPase domain-containing protein n=1 Tax=Oryza punctata TaxID=4537 RepID=A0A0E0MNB7_ORYPU
MLINFDKAQISSWKQHLERDAETLKAKTNILKIHKNVVIKDKFEKDILSNVIPPNDIGVHFEDIGALENVKVTLKKLVMVPLQRPELFCKGRLTKPVKGVLLFGPAGTGKTLLAKAIATEAGANFINISISSVASKWFGDGEKYVKAIFSLANQERVSVLGATNRPYDLDEAVIRRFSCRVMVDLPDALNRERILSVILSEEKLAPDVDLKTLANMTDGYSGSYLMDRNLTRAEGRPQPPECGTVDIRPLTMDDFKSALQKASASVSPDSRNMRELHQWNDLYGEEYGSYL